MPTQTEKADRFLALHNDERPLLMPNPWDRGSALLFASMGFKALATTSSGFAATLGRPDGGVTRDEAIGHSQWIAAGTDLPVSADLENCFADDPEGVSETVRLAVAAGLAGFSVEDFARREQDPIYDRVLAADRVAAAAEAAHSGAVHLVLTARAENYLHGNPSLSDTIARLQSYQEAGADVLFAPGVTKPEEIQELVAAVDLPVNVLALPGTPPVSQLAAMGVKRISVGGAFAFAGLSAVAEAASELRDSGTYGYWEKAAPGTAAVRAAFS
ncbi:MAG: isocitrate lyase/phosphoenolpyruvate mutase family protein [Nocardiopsaceae bacterium]|jgi:2-methylisocitrate lyase-like PEP mutase family enzyme|nr:isocitrate lyase/phosphoenolpyruvate mutase family protein [Nocardiopsaceae bacterium]